MCAKEYGYDISDDDGMVVVRSAWKLRRRLFQGTVNGKTVKLRVAQHAEGILAADLCGR